MQKYKSNITSTTGAAIRNVPVTVLNEAGELASLFLDRAGGIAASNPLATDSSGNFYFYAVNGRYSLRTTVDGVTITDNDVVLLQDPEEITVAGPIAEAVAAAQAAAKQAQDAVDASGIPDLVAAAQNAVIDSNQALQEARGASQASTEAKVAAESAKSAAELAKGDAQSASATASTAAQQASAAAQSAAQSAASIDPAAIYQAIGKKVDTQPNAGLMTDVERQRLAGIADGATKNETDSALRDRANHTGTQSIETVAGLSDALEALEAGAGKAVQQTSATGAALLPEGTDSQRPVPGSLPAGALLIRGNTQAPAEYKPEFWDRVAAAWKTFADRTWVGQQIDAAVASVQTWVNGQIGFAVIYPNGGSSASPANVTSASRYVMANPFSGRSVICEAQLRSPSGNWGSTGWQTNVGTGAGVGTRAAQLDDTIVVQTGGGGIASVSPNTGGSFDSSWPTGFVTSAPCRVIVWRVKG